MDEEYENMRKAAHAIIEARGGLRIIEAEGISRCKHPETKEEVPTLHSVSCCPFCLAPVWRSSSPAQEDSWKIYDWDARQNGFEACRRCEEDHENISPSARCLFTVMSVRHATLMGEILLRQKK